MIPYIHYPAHDAKTDEFYMVEAYMEHGQLDTFVPVDNLRFDTHDALIEHYEEMYTAASHDPITVNL